MQNIDASVRIKVTDNKLRVIANYTPSHGEGKYLAADDVMQQVESMGINTGIKSEVIENMCKSTRLMPSIVIAEGVKPQVGEKARIETYVDLNRESKALEREDGSIDFKNLGEICSAVADQDLYRKIPPTIGTQGVNVYGEEIPGLSGKDLKIVTGHGTAIDKNDPNLIKAAISGEIQVIKGILQVSDIHQINGDVNYKSGNVKFNGNVKIDGNVISGFKVEATGNVEIRGNIEDAEVIAGNDAIIIGGFTGTGAGTVQAGRDVFVKFIENQIINAGRDIFINGESYHARLSAGRSISAKGNKSAIVGGQCEAKISVEASRFGSVACPKTIIKVGIDPKLAGRIANIEAEIEKTQASQEELEKSIVFLYKIKIDGKGKLPPDKAAILKKLESAKKSLPVKLKSLESTKEELLKEQKELEKVYAISRSGVFPKVQVHIGNQWVAIEDNLGPSQFRLVNGEMVRLSK